MSVRRFFVDPAAIAEGVATLDAGEREHAVRVLRLGPGDDVVLFDGEGGEFPGRMLECGKRLARVRVGERRPCAADPVGARVTLLQGLPRLARVDWLVEKGTEAGLARFVPLLAHRSPPEAQRAGGRVARWRTIAREACRQCGRSRLTQVDSPLEPEAAWRLWADAQPPAGGSRLAILDPGAPQALADWLMRSEAGEWAVAVGPEGGWDETELERARAAGFEPVGLGPRTLRAETAAIAAVLAIQLLRGDLRRSGGATTCRKHSGD